MEYQWGAGCTERCKSGSERGLQKPVSQRHKALLSYSTMWVRRPSPHGRTVRATTGGCWRCAQKHIRQALITQFFCARAMAAHGRRIDCLTRVWLRRFLSRKAERALRPRRQLYLTSASSILRLSPAVEQTDRFALCPCNEVKSWAHFRRPPTAARPSAMCNMVPLRGVRAAAAARVRVRIRARRQQNPAWA